MHPLDNPIWKSLNTGHARFAEGAGLARRFIPEVSPLAGLAEPAAEAFAALASLVPPGGTAGLFLEAPAAPAGWSVEREVGLLQMVHTGAAFPPPAHGLVELGEADAKEMTALAHLTKPGPFSERTRELGAFLGVRVNGRLAAMTGERLKLPGFTEVSGVCTHPEHLGRGYARSLLAAVGARILARGETPFLHVLPGNERAIGVYERLGFVRRALLVYASLRRTAL